MSEVAVLGPTDDVSDAFVCVVAVVLVIMVLSTALPPLMRRGARTAVRPHTDAFGAPHGPLSRGALPVARSRSERPPPVKVTS